MWSEFVARTRPAMRHSCTAAVELEVEFLGDADAAVKRMRRRSDQRSRWVFAVDGSVDVHSVLLESLLTILGASPANPTTPIGWRELPTPLAAVATLRSN